MPQTTASPTTTPFLQLPGELCNVIYRLALALPSDGRIVVSSTDTYMDAFAHRIRSGILQTCSIFRNEASSILYSENTFCLLLDGLNNKPSLKWLEGLGTNIRFLRSGSIVLLLGVHEERREEMLAQSSAHEASRKTLSRWKRSFFESAANTDATAILAVLDGLHALGLARNAVEFYRTDGSFVNRNEYECAYEQRLEERLEAWGAMRTMS